MTAKRIVTKQLHWSRDGDQWVALSARYEYRITCWTLKTGDEYAVTVDFRNPNDPGWATVGEWNTLEEAKGGALAFERR
jgi:hypothetical protein